MCSKVKGKKAKINKWDLMILKSFCAALETSDKTKKSTEREKIFTRDMTDKGLIPNIYKPFTQLKNKNNPIKKWQKN